MNKVSRLIPIHTSELSSTNKSSETKKNQQRKIDKQAIEIRSQRKKRVLSSNTMVSIASKLSSKRSQGQEIETLLAILHDAIQKQQHYPSSALEMGRKGRVTVKFILFPNGSIQDLQIIKSSGTNSLDQAALSAVSNAAPFSQISQYLENFREFSIDIVFEDGETS